MRSRQSVEEKFEIVMEALTENTTQAEICRRHGIFPPHSMKWEGRCLNTTEREGSNLI
ncbi:MAG: hypothetical protein AMDU3_IPLC00004G0451 [Thermoplasmatales archaeon I-plasma]|jgi:transposase-like protein|nr:MAG: hypothetical protein AMDU3_IPLC00004G0451 [Thermoplasmatales archaeon I-plasma]